VLGFVIVAGFGIGGVLLYRYGSPEGQARRRDASLYAPLIHYPGSHRTERTLRSTGADSCFLIWCAHYSLHDVYALPADATLDAVKAHYRSHLPQGWKEADESACVFARGPGGSPSNNYTELRLASNALLLENPRRQRVTIVIEPPQVTVQPATYSCSAPA
jgi:hypothetical protein